VLTGNGHPQQVLTAVALGIDLIETSYPLEVTEHGQALHWTSHDLDQPWDSARFTKTSLNDHKHFKDDSPLQDGCPCYACKNHTRSYIHHLLNVREMLGSILLMMYVLFVR
jgi:queuine tRNA-ribosyltransferase accessory subunit